MRQDLVMGKDALRTQVDSALLRGMVTCLIRRHDDSTRQVPWLI